MKITTLPPTPPQRGIQPKGEAPQNPGGPSEEDKLKDQLLESLITSPEFTKEALRRVGRGDKVSIEVDGKPVVTIKSEGPTTTERVIRGFRAGVRTITEEVATVVDNDPAFMLRNAATVVKTQVYSGIPTQLQEIADKAFIPLARGASLALDGTRCYKTWTNPNSTWMDRSLDTLHVATDIAGLVGAVAPMVFPPLAPYADTLLAAGFAGDIVSYSYRGLQYFNRRSLGETPPPPPQ